MNKTNCYKCDREPSVHCGECPVWLADEAVSEKERIAYRQGESDGVKRFAEKIKREFEYYYRGNVSKKRLRRILLDMLEKEKNND